MSADSETSSKVMRYWKFLQKTKLKQNFFTNSEKEVVNFPKTETILKSLKEFEFLNVVGPLFWLIFSYLHKNQSGCSDSHAYIANEVSENFTQKWLRNGIFFSAEMVDLFQ